MNFTLIRNARVIIPQGIVKQNLLIGMGKVLAMAEDLSPPSLFPCELFDARGRILAPGIIDQHVHLTGAVAKRDFIRERRRFNFPSCCRAASPA